MPGIPFFFLVLIQKPNQICRGKNWNCTRYRVKLPRLFNLSQLLFYRLRRALGFNVMGTDVVTLASIAQRDRWVQLPAAGARPLARYKHAAQVIDEKLYIAGGNRNGRHLSDIQVFDLKSLVWSAFEAVSPQKLEESMNGSRQNSLPAVSGHSLVKWRNKLLIVAGYLKYPLDFVKVWSIDMETQDYHAVKTSGKIPIARGGQSVTIFHSKLIMFGGESMDRQLLNDIHILDLDTMIWEEVEIMQHLPAPRFDHIATIFLERYLMIFGGSSHSVCFNDLHVLDLETMEWSQPQMQDEVTARAGHAGAVIDDNWYIVGGGDNKSGSPETLVLDMSKLVWSEVANLKGHHPLVSEGLSLCSASVDGEKFLIAFGGYNGSYNNELFVLRTKEREVSHPKIYQSPAAAAAAAAASVAAAYSVTSAGSENMNLEGRMCTRENKIVDAGIFKTENHMMESKLIETRAFNLKLKRDVDAMNVIHTELSKELLSVHGEMVAEKSRCLKLEMQILDLTKRLESFNSIEHEVKVLRHQKST